MKHRLLGRSGLRVSELALGTLNFGDDKAWGVSAGIVALIASRKVGLLTCSEI